MKGYKEMNKKYKKALGFALLVAYALIVFVITSSNFGCL